tara:strand:+ start:3817 stop:4980 length:1164 start_codon:yes stop_codon:yes gene_type:complete
VAHIAWLGKTTPFCGNVIYGLTTTKELKDRGHKISFIDFNNNNLQKTNLNNLNNDNEISLPYLIKSQVYTIPSLEAKTKFKESIIKLKPDLIHASLTLSPLDFILPEICSQCRVPLICTFHPPFDSKLRNLTAYTQQFTYRIYASCLEKYHKVIVFCKPQAELLEKLGINKNKLSIIPNGVNENIWCPIHTNKINEQFIQIKKRLGEERVFIYLGRIANEKNIKSLLKVWKSIDTKGCQLVIVGDGPLKRTLENNFKSTSKNKIIWWGYESNLEKKVALLQASEVFILPSFVEGLSLSLLEAMATGNACIATDAGGDGEVLRNGAGIVISTNNVISQLKTIIPIFVGRKDLAKKLGIKARERILVQYTLDKNINRLEKLYQEVISSH